MKAIIKRAKIKAPVEEVWAALTDTKAIRAWMGDPAPKINLSVGGRYALFSGETTGTFTSILPNTVLEYTWRQHSWDAEWGDSLVRWELEEEGSRTHILLVHSQLPNEEERASHLEGWDDYWLEPMIDYLKNLD